MEQTKPHALEIEVIEVPNRGFMFEQPTIATIVGTHEVFIVDPGDATGVEVIQKALGERDHVHVKAILLTHGHPDHATAVPELKRLYNCPVMLNPKEQPILRQFLDWSGVDAELVGGMTLTIEGGELQTFDTPGHSPGHIAFYEPVSRTLIAGDLVSGNGTVGIFPPHGKMTEYLASLERMRQLDPAVVIPGHGPTITSPPNIFAVYIEHRLMREREIYAVVAREPTTIEAMIPELYPIVLPHFRRAAAATVLAHLEKLRAEGRVYPESDDLIEGRWSART